MTNETEPKKSKPAKLPELNLDVSDLTVRIGRAKANVDGARRYAAQIMKLADALDAIADSSGPDAP